MSVLAVKNKRPLPTLRRVASGILLSACVASVPGSARGAADPAASGLRGKLAADPEPIRPLTLVDQPDSIYPDANELPIRPVEGVNQGGVHLSLTVNYMTDYVYRGIDRSEVGSIDPTETGSASEDAPNLQFDGRLTFDLGRLPHPFVGAFVNVFNDDPVSRFQEVRPVVGFDWRLKPVLITAGWQTYIFPERDDYNTAEAFARLVLDDSFIFHTDGPIFSPYVFAAWDYDLYEGYYFEAGVTHDFAIEGTGMTITAQADVAYVSGNGYFSSVIGGEDSGFQHYDLGLIGTYSLNVPLNISRRFGEWKLRGYLFYTDGIETGLRADTQLWGGMGITFDY